MLHHLNVVPVAPSRVVVIGAGGFVGAAVAERLTQAGVPVLRLTRAEVGLLAPDAADRLAAHLRDGDSVVAAAAIAPCKTVAMLTDNAVLTLALVTALSRVALAHVVNIGSDAVFIDQTVPLTEDSPKAPDSLHGVMHLAREIAFHSTVTAPLAILRPTLIYGADD
ncbi:MAG TPA: NAD-dependent epimerase/dehydratase family protein, partial [Patescibacteria group bacterium]|nr:NAD-dependent epimerase/dehydratase family protein [Patescibacteria group bacterium]